MKWIPKGNKYDGKAYQKCLKLHSKRKCLKNTLLSYFDLVFSFQLVRMDVCTLLLTYMCNGIYNAKKEKRCGMLYADLYGNHSSHHTFVYERVNSTASNVLNDVCIAKMMHSR